MRTNEGGIINIYNGSNGIVKISNCDFIETYSNTLGGVVSLNPGWDL